MKRAVFYFICCYCAIWTAQRLFSWEYNEKDVVSPKVADKLERVILSQDELSGELNRRISDLVYKNYMVLDLDRDWLDYFRNRTDRNEANGVYYGIGKVMDAGALFAKYTNDSAVAERTEYILDSILGTMDEDGYIGFWNREPNEYQNFVNWIVHEQEYFALACVRYYRVSGSEKALSAAKRTVDFLIKVFPKNENNVYYIPSPISIAGVAEAAVELYRVTGESRYFDFAQNLQYEPHWFYEPFNSWRRNIESRPFHQYVMLSHLYPETERYRLTADPALLLKSDWMRHALLEKDYGALLVTGSSSNGEYFTRDQKGTGNIEESCVTAYLLRFFDSLMRLEGDMRYGDIMERTIYNALFAAQDPAGRKIRYFTAFSGERVYYDRDTFCCPGNFRRAVAEIPQKVYYRLENGGIAVNLYTESSKTFCVDGKNLTLHQKTDYPNSGHIEITVQTDDSVETVLAFRTPRWADSVSIQVNDEPVICVNPKEQENGIFVLTRNWQEGDSIKIDMPMAWRWIEGRMTQTGKAALLRGPVLYCLGAAKNPELVAAVPNLRDLVIDPESLGEPELDTVTRPDGCMVRACGWLPSNPDQKFDLIFTEFPDETGREIYFSLPENSPVKPVADELLDEPSLEPRWNVETAFYGPKADQPIEAFFQPQGEILADLAADYQRPEGDASKCAAWTGPNGTWSAWLCTGTDFDSVSDEEKAELSADKKVYATLDGYAYGSGDSDGLGFLADWNPSPQQESLWSDNFTDSVFNSIIPESSRGKYLLTHPVNDGGKNILIRYTPDPSIREKTVFLCGGFFVRYAGDGITVKVTASCGGQKAALYNSAIVRSESFFVPIPSPFDGPVDVYIGNNGTHAFDSTAFTLFIRERSGDWKQTDVKEKINALPVSGRTKTIGGYPQFFGADSDPSYTLKLKLHNILTGETQYRELPSGADIEL